MTDAERIHQLLQDRGTFGATPFEIMQITGITSYSQRIGELRNSGVEISNVYMGRTARGKRLTRYFLAKYAPNQLAA